MPVARCPNRPINTATLKAVQGEFPVFCPNDFLTEKAPWASHKVGGVDIADVQLSPLWTSPCIELPPITRSPSTEATEWTFSQARHRVSGLTELKWTPCSVLLVRGCSTDIWAAFAGVNIDGVGPFCWCKHRWGGAFCWCKHRWGGSFCWCKHRWGGSFCWCKHRWVGAFLLV